MSVGLQLSTQWTLRVLPVDHIRMAPESGESPGQIPRLVIQDKFLFNPKIQDRKVTPKTAQQKVELLLDIPNFNHEKTCLETSLKSQCTGFFSRKFLVN